VSVTGTADRIAEGARGVAERIAAALGLEVVEVVFRRQGKHSLLRIDVDRPGVPGVSLEDCERASREIEREIDEAALIESSYDLQVSSPGVDRPIVTDDDVRRNAGRPVKVEIDSEIRGETTLRGILRGVAGDSLLLELSPGNVAAIPRGRVAAARQDVEADLHPPQRGPRPRGKRNRRGIVGGSSS
jgi:ribosome maturation factor RimP